MSVLELDDVTRRYGDAVAVNRVSLSIDPGVTALVGPNGAGKSTLVKVATGHVKPSLGRVRAFGQGVWDNPAVMARMGLVPEQDAFYEYLSGIEFVSTLAQLQGLAPVDARDRAEEELRRLGLTQQLDQPIRGYSKGMRQRVKLAQALVHEPELLFLDEPLLGCDPMARLRIQSRVRELARGGCAVLLSSHILPEVERLTRDIAVLVGGRLVARGDAGLVRDEMSQIPSRVRLECMKPRAAAAVLVKWDEVTSVQVAPRAVEVATSSLRALLERVHAAPGGWGLTGLETLDADLDSLFGYLAEAA